MAQHARLRPTVAAVCALAVSAGLVSAVALPGTAAAAPAAAPAGAVIDAPSRFQPRMDEVFVAGEQGFLHREEGRAVEYTEYATGTTRKAENATWWNGTLGAWWSPAARTLELRPLEGEAPSVTLVLPKNQTWQRGHNASTVLTTSRETGGRTVMHLLRGAADGTVTDQEIPLGEGESFVNVLAQTREAAVIGVRGADAVKRAFLLDYATGTTTPLFAGLASTPSRVTLTDRYVAGWDPSSPQVLTLDRRNLDAPVVRTVVPGPVKTTTRHQMALEIAGDQLLVVHQEAQPDHHIGQPLSAVRIGGGDPVTVLPHAQARLTPAPDGSVLVAGGASASDWAVHRIGAGADGRPTAAPVHALPPVAGTVRGLALAGGRLLTVGTDPVQGQPSLRSYELTTSGTPRVVSGPDTVTRSLGDYKACPDGGPSCASLTALGNGWAAHPSGNGVSVPLGQNASRIIGPMSWERPEIVAATGRHVLVKERGSAKYAVGDLEKFYDSNVIHTFTATAAALWGNKVWKPATAAGTVAAYDVKTKKTAAAVDTGSGCKPTALQAVGRWIYWACGGTKAGVFDQSLGKSVSVPAGGEPRLGDGFLVRATGEDLMVTDFSRGAGTKPATTLLASGVERGHGIGWAVDPFGGNVAHVDADQRVHITDVPVPRSPVASIESRVEQNFVRAGGKEPWTGHWQLSRPADAWKVTFTDVTRKTVATVSGTARTAASISATWDGLATGGGKPQNGAHTWTVSVKAAGESSYVPVKTGTVQVSGGTAAYRDEQADGRGNVLTVNKNGTLTSHDFPATGVHDKWSRAGWHIKYTYVPFGDLTGDGCNDLLVRNTVGNLYRYDGVCGHPPAKTSTRTSLGGGWEAYNVLTSPGDLTGDGLPDLLARKSSTGDIWVFPGTKAGKLGAGKKIRTGWTYTHVVGAGDLNGDGHGDVLARAKDGTLYRYDGAGDGTLKSRVTVFTKWGSTYTHVLGVGDMTGDGKNDLLVVDNKGVVYRNTGNGKGSFSSRTKITTGWLTYKGIF
ncbi:FG-GAP-like repeat-containing protein [Streptomyces albidoflavus]|uniref:FG-GAP-like repeat-containing protein n=1 Tax=Streptomyces albidoflavus TaxID=1886 RepID=UPI003323833D